MIPADTETELSAVAAVIDAAGIGIERLEPSLLTHVAAVAVADAVRSMVAQRLPVSVESVLSIAGTEAANNVFSAAGSPGLDYCLPILRQQRALRLMLSAGMKLTAKAQELAKLRLSDPQDIRRALSEGSSDLSTAAAGLETGVRKTAKELMADLINALEAADRGELPPTIPTGIQSLERALGGGLRAGEMTVLGARTGVGKSAFATWISCEACRAGKRVLYVSRELTGMLVMARAASLESGVPIRIREGLKGIGKEGARALVGAAGRVKDWGLNIRSDLRTIAAITAEVRETKPDLVVVDHVGIIDAQLARKSATPTEETTANSNALRDLAFDSGVAVLCLAQINRAGADVDAPRLDHLKQSGALEEDARAVILMHLAEERDDGTQKIVANLAKNTSGPLALADLIFHPPTCRFREERRRPDPSAV